MRESSFFLDKDVQRLSRNIVNSLAETGLKHLKATKTKSLVIDNELTNWQRLFAQG
jgi:hypothetical protein